MEEGVKKLKEEKLKRERFLQTIIETKELVKIKKKNRENNINKVRERIFEINSGCVENALKTYENHHKKIIHDIQRNYRNHIKKISHDTIKNFESKILKDRPNFKTLNIISGMLILFMLETYMSDISISEKEALINNINDLYMTENYDSVIEDLGVYEHVCDDSGFKKDFDKIKIKKTRDVRGVMTKRALYKLDRNLT